MVNNSTNTKKTNNHLSPPITDHKKDCDMALEIHVIALDSHKNEVGSTQSMEYQPSPS